MNNLRLQQIKKLLVLMILIIVIINSVLVTYRLAKPELPSIRIYDRNMDEIEFPISFQICLYELENRNKRYRDMGYRDVFYFTKEAIETEFLWTLNWSSQNKDLGDLYMYKVKGGNFENSSFAST